MQVRQKLPVSTTAAIRGSHTWIVQQFGDQRNVEIEQKRAVKEHRPASATLGVSRDLAQHPILAGDDQIGMSGHMDRPIAGGLNSAAVSLHEKGVGPSNPVQRASRLDGQDHAVLEAPGPDDDGASSGRSSKDPNSEFPAPFQPDLLEVPVRMSCNDDGRRSLPESQRTRQSPPVTKIQQADVTLQVLPGIFRAGVDEEQHRGLLYWHGHLQ